MLAQTILTVENNIVKACAAQSLWLAILIDLPESGGEHWRFKWLTVLIS